MRRGIFSVIISAVIIFCTSAGVCADVVIEPIDDGFYREHWTECRYINDRHYTVLEDCHVYNNPFDREAVVQLTKGDEIVISYEYTDDNSEVWGSYQYDLKKHTYGWLRMSAVAVVYDDRSFIEEYEDDIAEYNGELDGLISVEPIPMWEYPNAAEIKDEIQPENWFPDELVFDVDDLAVSTYTDSSGEVWVRFTYLYYGWVKKSSFVSENTISETSTETTSAAQSEDTATSLTEIISEQNESFILSDFSQEEYSEVINSLNGNEQDKGKTMTLPIILALSSVIISGALLFVLTRKK